MDREQVFHDIAMMVLNKRAGSPTPENAVTNYLTILTAVKAQFAISQSTKIQKPASTAKVISPGIDLDL